MAKKYHLTTAQALIRWCLQRDVIVIPKSTTPARIKENASAEEVFGAEHQLTEEDMRAMDAFDEYFVTGWDPTTGP